MILGDLLTTLAGRLSAVTPTVSERTPFVSHPMDDERSVADMVYAGAPRRLQCVGPLASTPSLYTSMGGDVLDHACEVRVGYPASWMRERALSGAIAADAAALMGALVDPATWSNLTQVLVVPGGVQDGDVTGPDGPVGKMLVIPFTVEV